jgi:hypothetical protein
VATDTGQRGVDVAAVDMAGWYEMLETRQTRPQPADLRTGLANRARQARAGVGRRKADAENGGRFDATLFANGT